MAERDNSPASTSSTLSCITVDAEKPAASRSSFSASPPTSTPPTSLGDEGSVLSDAMKIETQAEALEDVAVPSTPTEAQAAPMSTSGAPNSEGKRPTRASRASVSTYNVQILAGTAIHTPTKYLEKHHKNVLHGPIETPAKANSATPPKRRTTKLEPDNIDDPAEEQLASETAQAAQRRRSSRVDLRKDVLKNLAAAGEAVAQKGPGFLAGVKNKVQLALRNNQPDLPSKSDRPQARGLKRSRTFPGAAIEEKVAAGDKQEKEYVKPLTKRWEKQGLYVGQDRSFDARLSESQNRLRRKSYKTKESTALPLPIFAGERMLSGDFRRDFKLPYNVYNPLPRKVKVDGWVKLQKNRFIGDASALWKREKQDSSSCYCSPEDGCGETCHNRIMSYECDSTNCRLTPEQCRNRPFAQLKRRAKGNGYDYGVEVQQTEDRGYGVRAMRSFEPHQIIVEYAGEIITQAECERRMKQIYKKDKCYYLMSFDNKMIIDATRGTIARFVNHSCEPNCEMIKWTVSGEPRMALFAGSRGIMTGEELTYDYNFDPFSSKNIQECRCGTELCRGVLGPKPKHHPPEKSLASTLMAGTKRKLQEVFGAASGSHSAQNSPKKRRMAMGTSAETKARNAQAEKAAARVNAEKVAAEQAAQSASRQNRALRRSTSMTLSSRRSKARLAARHSLPALKSTRQTTVSYKRGTPKALSKPGTLKPVKRLTSLLTRSTPLIKTNKRLLNSSKTSNTPVRSHTPESDDSPNITPASLRSAKRKFTQTKLPFVPLKLDGPTSARTEASLGFPDSDDDAKEFGSLAKRPKNVPRGAAASMKKSLNRSIRGTKHAVNVAKAGAGLRFGGMGGLREGGSRSTIRMITGVDDD